MVEKVKIITIIPVTQERCDLINDVMSKSLAECNVISDVWQAGISIADTPAERELVAYFFGQVCTVNKYAYERLLL